MTINIQPEEERQPPKRAPPANARNRGPKEDDTRTGEAESQAERQTSGVGKPQAASREAPGPLSTLGKGAQEETCGSQCNADHRAEQANMKKRTSGGGSVTPSAPQGPGSGPGRGLQLQRGAQLRHGGGDCFRNSGSYSEIID